MTATTCMWDKGTGGGQGGRGQEDADLAGSAGTCPAAQVSTSGPLPGALLRRRRRTDHGDTDSRRFLSKDLFHLGVNGHTHKLYPVPGT